MKLISIIVPVYNCEKYLDDCFMSIEKQDFDKDSYEVIIINDGSKDNSLQLIKKYCSKNKNWRYIDQNNQGLSMARNNGLELVKSEYVTFLDSDDTLPTDALSNLYNSIIENSADVVIGGLINYNSAGYYDNYTSKYLVKMYDVSYKNYKHLLNFVHSAGKLYRYSSVKNIKFIKGLKHEDNYYTGKIYLNNYKINMINKIVYNHRISEGNDKSITQSMNYSSYVDYLENIDCLIKENNYNYIFTKTYILKIYNYILRFVEYNHAKEAKEKAKELIGKMINKTNCSYIRKKYLIILNTLLNWNIKKLKKIRRG